MYKTETLLRRQLRVRYPAGRGQMALRTEMDWDRGTPGGAPGAKRGKMPARSKDKDKK